MTTLPKFKRLPIENLASPNTSSLLVYAFNCLDIEKDGPIRAHPSCPPEIVKGLRKLAQTLPEETQRMVDSALYVKSPLSALCAIYTHRDFDTPKCRKARKQILGTPGFICGANGEISLSKKVIVNEAKDWLDQLMRQSAPFLKILNSHTSAKNKKKAKKALERIPESTNRMLVGYEDRCIVNNVEKGRWVFRLFAFLSVERICDREPIFVLTIEGATPLVPGIYRERLRFPSVTSAVNAYLKIIS